MDARHSPLEVASSKIEALIQIGGHFGRINRKAVW